MPGRKEPSSREALEKALSAGVPLERWKEGLMFDGMNPTPGLRSASNWFPRTEELGPDEIRIIFMGTSPTIRPGQMNTSILVQLGNGDNFVFDLGEGSIANYVAAGMALNELDKIFITHLHVDHFGSLPYLYMFGGWAGRWHKPLRVFGPSGHEPEYGTDAMIDGMKKMVGWHKDAFSIFPVGKAWDIEVNEFDFRDNGGVIYNENGVEVIHWQRSHAKDGASGYRLNWNGMSVVWTGDGRPSDLDIEYATGADVYITEAQPEVIAISSGVQGVPPFVGRFTVDMHHTPAYAAGYLASQIQPRLLMTTHMPFDTYLNEETVAEVRHHWDGPYHFGAPDGIVVNVTRDDIWVREGILPDYPNNKAPQFDFDEGQLVVPAPHHAREDIQEPFVRDHEISPETYYPEGYHPGVLTGWPVDGELVAPVEVLPEKMFQSMSENWRKQQTYKKHIAELTAEAERPISRP